MMEAKNKILFLEDEEILGQIYSRHLEESGFDVHWARDTDTLKSFAAKGGADAVILDQAIENEAQAGVRLIPFLKKSLPGAKVAILSNYSHFHMGKAALKAGADAYWVKLNTPPGLLVELLRKLLLQKN